MKKIIAIFICVLLSNLAAPAQENSELKLKKNEIRLALSSLLYLYPEIDYERILSSNDQGVGISIAFPLSDFDTQFRLVPYYRFYFQKESTSKFFIEANAALLVIRNDWYDYSDTHGYSYSYRVNAGLGCATGYKYVNQRNGIVGEVYIGMGRALGSSYLYPRIGISLGKKF